MNNIINKIDILIKSDLEYENTSINLVEIYYELGKYLYKNKKSYNLIYETENLLRKKYGLLIGFTKRNLNNMVNFYKEYQNYDINKLKKIPWNLHLIILKQENKDELIDYCLKYKIDKKNLNKIIKNGFDKKYILKLKENDDTVTLEFIKKYSSK